MTSNPDTGSDLLTSRPQTQFDQLAESVPGEVLFCQLGLDGAIGFSGRGPGLARLHRVGDGSGPWTAHQLFRFVPEPDRKRLLEGLYHSAKRLTPWRCEYPVKAGRRARVHLELSARPQSRLDGSVEWVGCVLDVSERYYLEQALLRAQEKFRFLAESTRDLVTLHAPNGEFMYVSHSVRHLLGHVPDQLTGASPFDYVHPGDVDRVRDLFRKLAVQGETERDVQYRFRRRDGSYAWLESRATGYLDGEGQLIALQCTSRDITEQRALMSALVESEQRAGTPVESPALEFFWEVDDHGRYMWVSSQAESIAGIPPVILETLSPFDLMPPEERTRVWNWFSGLRESGRGFSEIEHRVLRNGELRWWRVSGMPLFSATGELTGYRGAARDVTEQKQVQGRLTQMAGAEPVSGLPNERVLAVHFERAQTRARIKDLGIVIVWVQVEVTEASGGGDDEALVAARYSLIIQRLEALLRPSQTLACIEPGQFVMLLPDLVRDEAVAVAHRMRARVEESLRRTGLEQPVGPGWAHVGTALCPRDGEMLVALLNHARQHATPVRLAEEDPSIDEGGEHQSGDDD